MNFNSDFKYDLELGQLGEKYLNEILSNKKIEVKTAVSYTHLTLPTKRIV